MKFGTITYNQLFKIIILIILLIAAIVCAAVLIPT